MNVTAVIKRLPHIGLLSLFLIPAPFLVFFLVHPVVMAMQRKTTTWR